MQQYSISNCNDFSLNNQKYDNIEIWRYYRSNYYSNPLTENQAVKSGNYNWIMFNKEIWISSEYVTEVKMLLEHNPRVILEPNYETVVSAIKVLTAKPDLKYIEGYAKRSIKQSYTKFLMQVKNSKLFAIIGCGVNVEYIKSKLNNVSYIDETMMPTAKILNLKNIPIIITPEMYLEIEEDINDYNYIWHIGEV